MSINDDLKEYLDSAVRDVTEAIVLFYEKQDRVNARFMDELKDIHIKGSKERRFAYLCFSSISLSLILAVVIMHVIKFLTLTYGG